MAENTKRAITFIVFAVGIVLGVLGWTSVAYSPLIGTIVFICLVLAAITLRILWGIRRR